MHFKTYAGTAYVLKGINLDIHENDFLGLVGETGCGKSMTCFSILRLIPPGGVISAGKIFFRGEDLLQKPENEMMKIRGKRISMISQDPSAYLNPLFTIGQQLIMIIRQHHTLTKAESIDRALEMLRVVELPNPQRIMKAYPHELSGGMKQRAAIAMALSCAPDLLIADEPTTDLDVTIQARILELLQKLREERHLTIIMVTHDLAVVAEACEKVAVLYAGRLVESGDVKSVLYHPKHPYTQALLRCSPGIGSREQPLEAIPGRVPSSFELVSGCDFHPRCPHATAKCKETFPSFNRTGGNHYVACHIYGELQN